MTTIQQLMQTGPAKANEIFAKLVDTSPTAVKARERVVSELKGELDRHARFEEERLFPVLKKHDETKGLVVEALKDNEQMRKLLADLERTPKDGAAFGAKVTALRDLFRKHLRDDRMEFLPAVMKALSAEEVGDTARKIAGETTEAEPARRADAGERLVQDERRAHDEHETAAAARQTADIAEAGSALAQQGATLARMATEADADLAHSAVALLSEQARHALQAQAVMAAARARTAAEVAQVQGAFMAASFQRMGQFNERYRAFMRNWMALVPFPAAHR